MDTYTLPSELRYTASHLWVRDDDGIAVVGLTEHGQELYGRILFVGLPAVGAPAEFGMPVGYLQSVGYGLTQLFPPVRGRIDAINENLWPHPELINEDPLGEGWVLAIAMSRPADLEELETAQGYRAVLAGERAAGRAELAKHYRESPQPVFLIDDRRRVLDCNPAAERLIGLTRREMRHGPLCAELFGCHVDDDQPLGKATCPGLCAMLNLEPIEDAEYTVTNAQGGETRVRATYTPLAEPGAPRRAVVVLTPLS